MVPLFSLVMTKTVQATLCNPQGYTRLYTILYYSIPYYTILHYIILYYRHCYTIGRNGGMLSSIIFFFLKPVYHILTRDG